VCGRCSIKGEMQDQETDRGCVQFKQSSMTILTVRILDSTYCIPRGSFIAAIGLVKDSSGTDKRALTVLEAGPTLSPPATDACLRTVGSQWCCPVAARTLRH
jgi:hypothetical protein